MSTLDVLFGYLNSTKLFPSYSGLRALAIVSLGSGLATIVPPPLSLWVDRFPLLAACLDLTPDSSTGCLRLLTLADHQLSKDVPTATAVERRNQSPLAEQFPLLAACFDRTPDSSTGSLRLLTLAAQGSAPVSHQLSKDVPTATAVERRNQSPLAERFPLLAACLDLTPPSSTGCLRLLTLAAQGSTPVSHHQLSKDVPTAMAGSIVERRNQPSLVEVSRNNSRPSSGTRSSNDKAVVAGRVSSATDRRQLTSNKDTAVEMIATVATSTAPRILSPREVLPTPPPPPRVNSGRNIQVSASDSMNHGRGWGIVRSNLFVPPVDMPLHTDYDYEYHNRSNGGALMSIFSFTMAFVSSKVYSTLFPNTDVQCSMPGLHLLHDSVLQLKKSFPGSFARITSQVWHVSNHFMRQLLPPVCTRRRTDPLQFADHLDLESLRNRAKRSSLKTADKIRKRTDKLLVELNEIQRQYEIRAKQNAATTFATDAEKKTKRPPHHISNNINNKDASKSPQLNKTADPIVKSSFFLSLLAKTDHVNSTPQHQLDSQLASGKRNFSQHTTGDGVAGFLKGESRAARFILTLKQTRTSR